MNEPKNFTFFTEIENKTNSIYLFVEEKNLVEIPEIIKSKKEDDKKKEFMLIYERIDTRKL